MILENLASLLATAYFEDVVFVEAFQPTFVHLGKLLRWEWLVVGVTKLNVDLLGHNRWRVIKPTFHLRLLRRTSVKVYLFWFYFVALEGLRFIDSRGEACVVTINGAIQRRSASLIIAGFRLRREHVVHGILGLIELYLCRRQDDWIRVKSLLRRHGTRRFVEWVWNHLNY